jgi:hypothetical protein
VPKELFHRREPSAGPDAFREPEADPPVIDEISAEKSEVCEGEDNLITVRAHAKDPHDNGYLRYVIAGQVGSQVAVRSFMRSRGDPAQLVQVIGRSNKTTTAELPPFQVRKCKVSHVLTITMRLLPNTADQYEFVAQVRDSDPHDRFVPVQYAWDFGDKTTERSYRASVTHHFEPPDEDAVVSRFLVTAEAIDSKGQKVVGRLQANLPNSEFENLKYKGVLVLSYSMNPPFPKMDAAGVIEQKVRIWHHQPYPVRLRHVALTGTLKRDEGAIHLRDADPAEILGTSSVPSAGIEAVVRFDTKMDEKIAMIDYLVTGEAADGTPAVARFSMMRPPDQPTRESAIAVTDATLNAKVLKARELLNQEFVTDEDILTLEREGAFAGLRVDPDFKPGSFGMPKDLTMKPGTELRDTSAVPERKVVAPAGAPAGSEVSSPKK